MTRREPSFHDRPIRIADAEQTLKREFGDAGPIGAAGPDAVATRPGDDFASKLVKYIPAEALAFVALISSFSGITEAQVVTIIAVGFVGQMLWLRRQGAKLPPADHPTWRQYILSRSHQDPPEGLLESPDLEGFYW